MMCRDLKLASLLGFTSLRTLVSTPLDVIEGSLAYTEKSRSQDRSGSPCPVLTEFDLGGRLYDLIRRSGSKYFGFIPDMGIFCKRYRMSSRINGEGREPGGLHKACK